MFSDILTPLPSIGIEWDIKKGFGPIISTPIRSMEDVRRLKPMEDPASSVPFVQQILGNLRSEVGNASTVLGFVGSPWTLAAYSIQAGSSKHYIELKQMMHSAPEVVHAFLDHLTEALIVYVCYQIDSGAQVVQLFDSWAHVLTPQQFAEFSLPYAQKVIDGVRAQRPGTPLMFHANGGVGKLQRMAESTADVLGLDWSTDMAEARAVLGPDRVLQGNMDPAVLFASEDVIRREVTRCLQQAGPHKHILNVGHGVIQKTPEDAVALFCELARQSASIHQDSTASNGSTLNGTDIEELKEMARAEVGLVGC
ncbi:g12224 [Coccomyxa viridis]|uniref:G12224 protein n=1 Tax=Coccomyxa viridis TaxID=1274662 RepID=A0ABP1GA66_9CHLO